MGARLRRLGSAVLLGSCLLSPQLSAIEDPLDAPALHSALAQRSVLTAVTRAGGRLVAVGERGHILWSDDRGRTWTQARVPVAVTLAAVSFVDAQRGWAVGHGGVILRSTDGGQSWTKQLDGRQFVEQLKAGANGHERFGRLIEEGPDKPFLDVYFRDAEDGIAVGAYGLIAVTSDGGRHWQPAFERLPPGEERHLYRLRPIGAHLFLVGEQGALFRSAADGRRFEELPSPQRGTFFSVAGSGADLVLMGLRGALYRSGDGGASWRRLGVPVKFSFTAGIIDRNGDYVIVDDGGGVWRLPARSDGIARLPVPAGAPLAGLEAAGDGALILVGARGVMVTPPVVPLAAAR